MTFLQPMFAWGFLSLALILALYLLKRKHEPRLVPSTFLWQKVTRDTSVNRPLQRLKRNILLLLHLLMAAVLVLTLMRSVLLGQEGGETVMIFDLSASMQAESGGQTRLEKAVEDAKGLLDGLAPGDAVTILAAEKRTQQLLSRSTDREAARRALESLTASNGGCDLSEAVSLARAMERETGELNIVVFSDDYRPPEGVSAHNAAQGLTNRAVVSFTMENGQGYARVANYGPEAEVTVACYAQGQLCDARTLRIGAGESAGTTLAVPDCAWAYVELQEQDAIAADNRLYRVARQQSQYKVALAGGERLFLERAIRLREDITLLNADVEDMASVSADLYIYGDSPLYFSLDAQQTGIQAGEQSAASGVPQLNGRDEITDGLSLSDVAVRAYRPLSGGRTLITLDGNAVLCADERTVALGFDIHDSNLPMKYDFPILIQNILQTFLPANTADVGDGLCDQTIWLALPGDCLSASVTAPGGGQTALDAADGAKVRFDQTRETGLYTLRIDGGSQAGERYFALRMPLEESDVRIAAPSVDAQGQAASFERGADLTALGTVVFLMLLLIEWMVRRRVV